MLALVEIIARVRLLIVAALVAPLVSCSRQSGDAAASPKEPTPDEEQAYWPERTTEELREALHVACEASTREGKALLLVFSAPWCGDCRDLWRAERTPQVRDALRAFRKVVANVARFDAGLVEYFEVEYLPTLVAFRTPDCTKAVETWVPVARTSLAGLGREAAPEERVAAWLQRVERATR